MTFTIGCFEDCVQDRAWDEAQDDRRRPRTNDFPDWTAVGSSLVMTTTRNPLVLTRAKRLLEAGLPCDTAATLII